MLDCQEDSIATSPYEQINCFFLTLSPLHFTLLFYLISYSFLKKQFLQLYHVYVHAPACPLSLLFIH